MSIKAKSAEIQKRIAAGGRFSIDWPPGFVPQPYTPKREQHPNQLANLAKGKQAGDARTRAKQMTVAVGTPFNPSNR